MNLNEYYKIQGTPALREELGRLTTNNELLEALFVILYDPIVWIVKQPMAFINMSLDIPAIKIKLLFLVYLRETYIVGQTDSEFLRILQSLLGEKPVSIDVFDKWWSIEFADVIGYDEAENDVTIENLEMLAKTGIDEVDEWVADLISKKRAKPAS